MTRTGATPQRADIGAIEVGDDREAGRIARVAAGSGHGRRRHDRPDRGAARLPRSGRHGLGAALGGAIRAEALERGPVDVDLREAAGDELVAEVAAAREPDVREQPPVAVARVLRPVAAEHDGLRERELSRACGCGRREAGTALGRVDPDQPHPLALAAREPHPDRVAVHHLGHDAPLCEASGGCRRCVAGQDQAGAGEQTEGCDERGPFQRAARMPETDLTVNRPDRAFCRADRLAADAGAAADSEPPLERAVLLAVLARRPDEGGEHDDHAEEREDEEEDSGGGRHAPRLPARAVVNGVDPRSNGYRIGR